MAKTMTDDYMVTMKFQNKSQMFNRTGFTGNILSPLQNFAMTWIGQFREFSKQAPKGTLAPITTFLAINLMTAGIVGTIGYKEWDLIAHILNKLDILPFHVMSGTEWLFSAKRNTKMMYGIISDLIGAHVISDGTNY